MPTLLETLEAERERLRAQLARIGDLRPGSLVSRYRKCGKLSCHCAATESEGHGPSWSLTRHVEGKTVTHIIPEGPALQRTQEQLAEYRRFRQIAREFVEVSDQICNCIMEQSKAETIVKKNRTRRRAPRRHSRRA